uniref:Uncharacterized protein n=1 Tax=Arundo donax TaxID=35708 RepID=A0A0A8YDC4_ARUDO
MVASVARQDEHYLGAEI